MCGIFGYVGKKTNIQRVLIDNLRTLEYRGYDSAGLAFVTDKIEIIKGPGRISDLETKIDNSCEGKLGIAHTRWATHGIVSEKNSHPHQVGCVTIVHNGIIENYMELRGLLEKEGYNFKTDTDTEVACCLLNYLKQKKLWNNLEVIKEFAKYIKGSYALGIIFEDELDTLYATRKDSPLVIGVSKDANLIASDVCALLNFTKEYCLLDDGDIIVLKENSVKIHNQDLREVIKPIQIVDWDIAKAEKNGYEHFMLKEIHEQGKVLKNTISEYIDNIDYFINNMPDFRKYQKIHIVACGSAMHAGLIGKYILENQAGIEVNVEVASEYRYKKVFFDDKTLVILISQSGETADTIAALRKAKKNGIDTLAIVNVVGSSIAREADRVLYIRAGVEVAVATTKAYVLQVAMLLLINIKLMIERNRISINRLKGLLSVLKKSPKIVNKVLEREQAYFEVAKELASEKNVFFIGRGIDYAMGLEGSLKLKEISYIHSEAYQAGELKHGTISLIEEHTKVIAILTDEKLALKTISNIKEVSSRGADIILLTTEELNDNYEFVKKKIVLPKCDNYLLPIVSIIPLQLMAYEVAKLRNCDIDKPRNLAKSVTVE